MDGWVDQPIGFSGISTFEQWLRHATEPGRVLQGGSTGYKYHPPIGPIYLCGGVKLERSVGIKLALGCSILKFTHKKPPPFGEGFLIGGAKRDRTADLNTASVALSQLSYSPKFVTA